MSVLNYVAVFQDRVETTNNFDVYTVSDGSVEPLLVGSLQTIENPVQSPFLLNGSYNLVIEDFPKFHYYNFVWELKTSILNDKAILDSPAILNTNDSLSTVVSYFANVSQVENSQNLNIIIKSV